MIRTPNPPDIISWGSIFIIVIPLLALLLPFWVIGVICAGRAEKSTGVRPTRWLLLVATLFLGLILYVTLADLARIGLEQMFQKAASAYYSYRSYSNNQLIKDISARMVITLLGVPLFALAWYKATQKAESETQEKSEVLTRKYFLTLEVIILGAIVVVSLGVCLYHLFNRLLGVSETTWRSLSPAIAYGGVAAVFLVFKLSGLRSTKKETT